MPGPDLRLLAPASLAWGAAWLLIRLDPAGVARIAAALGAAALLLLLVPSGAPGSRRGWRGAGALAVGVAAAVLAAGAVQLHARTAGPFGAAVAAHGTVVVEGSLQSAPRTAQEGCLYLVDVHRVVFAGHSARAAAPVQILGPCADLAAGATVRVGGRLTPPASPGRAAAVLRASQGLEQVRAPTGAAAVAAGVRAAAGRAGRTVPGEAGTLLPAIAWGDTSRLSEDLVAAMRTAGLTHVTAVSGAHFALVSALVLLAGAAVRLPRWARAALTAVVAAGLVVLVGPEPSVLRAAVMGAVSVVGLLVGRPSAGPAALATAVVGLLLADPWLAVEPGFVLSVAATAGIVLVVPTLVVRWSPVIGRATATLLGVPLVAQLVCAPLLIAFSPNVATWAVVANLAVAPAIGPATILGLVSAVLAPGWPAGAAVAAQVAGAACWWVVTVAHLTAAAPAAGLAWWPGVVGGLLLAGTGIGLLGLLLRGAPDPHGTLDGCPDPDDPPAASRPTP
ncbi:MAG: ComEC/Rec2 family competence protein [Actinobacteria bacterium]|nr:ComEC/Rec2 family competence protein [Actinomycetota bacterium]MCG2801120.1 ComEC/Rec2 family competence protein [Cellulomonas sp.]